MFNKIILVGNLTRDIEVKYSQAGMTIAKTAIATSRKFKSNTGEQKEEVCFVDITFFGRSAEIANQYLHKGSKILVEGRLVFEQWSDQNGQKRSKHGITVDVMQMLDSKRDAESNPQQHVQQTQVPTYEQKPVQTYSNSTQASKQTYQKEERPLVSKVSKIDVGFTEEELPF